MTTSIDLHLAEIVRSYLDSPASHAAGVPALPIRRMDDGAELVFPSLVVRADDRGGFKARTILVTLVLHTAQEQGAPADTPAQWLQAIDARLRDQAAFFDHLAALPVADRTGWRLLHHSFPSPADVQREEDGTAARFLALQCLVQL